MMVKSILLLMHVHALHVRPNSDGIYATVFTKCLYDTSMLYVSIIIKSRITLLWLVLQRVVTGCCVLLLAKINIDITCHVSTWVSDF